MIYICNILGFNKIPLRYVSYKKIKDIYKNIYGNKYLDYNLEHIVPQSKIKNNKLLRRDMHNILLYPRMLNTHRSNYKYTNNDFIYQNSLLLDEQGFICNNSLYIPEKNSIKTSSMKIFCPNTSYRGEISRSCMYFIYTYEKYTNMVLKDVIDLDTLIMWNELHPVTELEEYKNKIIYDNQGNENIFISQPKKIYNYINKFII